MFNILPNGRYIANGIKEPTKNYPCGYKTNYVRIIDDISSDERNNKGCIIGQKITAIGKRCGSNTNVDTISYFTFLQNGQYLLTTSNGSQFSGKWTKTENTINFTYSGFDETFGKIVKFKGSFEINPNNNNIKYEAYAWICKNWKKIYVSEEIFVAPLEC